MPLSKTTQLGSELNYVGLDRVFRRALDSQLLHSATKGAGIHAENPRRAMLAFDHPMDLVQDRFDVGPLHLIHDLRLHVWRRGRFLWAPPRRRPAAHGNVPMTVPWDRLPGYFDNTFRHTSPRSIPKHSR